MLINLLTLELWRKWSSHRFIKPKEVDNSNTMSDRFLKQLLSSINIKKNLWGGRGRRRTGISWATGWGHVGKTNKKNPLKKPTKSKKAHKTMDWYYPLFWNYQFSIVEYHWQHKSWTTSIPVLFIFWFSTVKQTICHWIWPSTPQCYCIFVSIIPWRATKMISSVHPNSFYSSAWIFSFHSYNNC